MSINILITINAATLITIIVLGVKVVRYLDKIEFKTNLMWNDYISRINMNKPREHAFNED